MRIEKDIYCIKNVLSYVMQYLSLLRFSHLNIVKEKQ